MKKIALAVMLVLGLFLLVSCAMQTEDQAEPGTVISCILSYGHSGTLKFTVRDYCRLSDGWVAITGVDGTHYTTHGSNVLLMKTVKKE